VTPAFTTAGDLFGSWLADVESDKKPVRFALPEPFAALDVRPSRVLMFGGAPGSGKTAALMQLGTDLLRQNDGGRLLVANVEMAPTMLVERIVSRVSGVPLTALADRTLTADHRTRVRAVVKSLRPVAARLAFLQPPYALEHVAAAASAFDANVLMLDYIQRFTVGDVRQEKRDQLEAAAVVLRRFADAGAVVLVASAVSRQRGQSGSTYTGLNLASFRGSSELEYGADSAYLFTPGDGGLLTLTCEKNRNAAESDIVTRFDPTTQTFAVAPSGLAGFDGAAPVRKAKGG
jgi:replicative DNA helicase